MDIGAVERVRPVERVGMRLGPGDLAPALGVEASERMEEDSYRDAGDAPKRGTDDPPEGEEEESPERPQETGDMTRVSLFA